MEEHQALAQSEPLAEGVGQEAGEKAVDEGGREEAQGPHQGYHRPLAPREAAWDEPGPAEAQKGEEDEA